MFPESPRWLVMKGRHDEALKTLARLHANGNTEDLFVKTELEDIINGVEKERAESDNAIYPADPNNPNGNKSAHYAFVIMTWVFNFAFSAAIGPISWAYPVEIFGSATRARGTAITSMAAWIANFMIAQVTPIAFNHIHWRYYLVFAICGYTNALTVWALFPETKGRKLEEMDDLFKHAGWFVPTQNYAVLSATQRENELRAGNAFGGEDSSDSPYAVDADEKDRVVKTEHKV
ncbi:hypothetical protein FRC10_003992 [Ceratobasidium sp. 414]|nr:hypothetical protein FRC10_003992 [Ceratobasidium sp. 414]